VTDAANRIVQKLWSYCNVLTRRMTRADLDEFVACYRPGQRQSSARRTSSPATR
jgi:hypothetical protein